MCGNHCNMSRCVFTITSPFSMLRMTNDEWGNSIGIFFKYSYFVLLNDHLQLCLGYGTHHNAILLGEEGVRWANNLLGVAILGTEVCFSRPRKGRDGSMTLHSLGSSTLCTMAHLPRRSTSWLKCARRMTRSKWWFFA